MIVVVGRILTSLTSHYFLGKSKQPIPKFLEFKADDGTTLYGRLLLPPDAPASGKIPVIVNIYGGPAAQTPPG